MSRPNPNQETNRPRSRSSSSSNSSISILVNSIAGNDSCGRKNILSVCRYPNFDDLSVLNIDLPTPESYELKIIGHSHGIYCLSDARRGVFLCNPNTAEFRKLPSSILLINKYSYPIAMGFGYDPKSNDFKVVRVVTFVDPPYHYHPSRVELYDLSTDQWREINTPVPGYYILEDTLEISNNGVYYSLALNHNYEFILISFDMTQEIFRQVPLPQGYNMPLGSFWFCENGLSIPRFGVLKGSIIMFLSTWIDAEGKIDVWEMKNNESSGDIFWSNLLMITSIPKFWLPLLFVNSDELLLIPHDSIKTVVSYNLIKKEFTILPMKKGFHDYYIFENTSVSVEGGRKEAASLIT